MKESIRHKAQGLALNILTHYYFIIIIHYLKQHQIASNKANDCLAEQNRHLAI